MASNDGNIKGVSAAELADESGHWIEHRGLGCWSI